MNKTVFLHNGSEFDSKYPNGIVPQDELAAVGQYENIFSFVKNVFGVDPASLEPSININTNSNVDVSSYAYAYVSVPVPSGYIIPSGTKSIANNGSGIDVNSYQYVNVAVPASAVVSGTKSITSNGTGIDVTTYANVNVNVPIPSGYIIPSGTKSISSNGTGIDVTSYKYVDVSVSGGGGITPTGTYNITSNGTYDVTTYASAYVNVSGGVQPVYTDATISNNSPLVVNLNAGETLEIYNLNHVNLNVLYSDTASSLDGYGAGGTYEYNYITAGDYYGTPSEGMIVRVMTNDTGTYGIKYRIIS